MCWEVEVGEQRLCRAASMQRTQHHRHAAPAGNVLQRRSPPWYSSAVSCEKAPAQQERPGKRMAGRIRRQRDSMAC